MAESLNLSDRRMEPPPPQALAPLGNGKRRVALIVLTFLLSVTGTIFTAHWTAAQTSEREAEKAQAALDKAVAIIEERQRNQNAEVLRAIDALREDIRAMNRRR